MASEWQTVQMGRLCDLRAGSAFKLEAQGRTSGDYPFIKVSDMNLPANALRIYDANNWISHEDLQALRAKPLPAGTVIFAKIGEALRQNRLRQLVRPTVVDNNMMGAVPNHDAVDPQYFFYALARFDFASSAQGTALPYLTVSVLSKLEVQLPSIPEQLAIASILGTLDDKIELNRRMNETLEAMARALFKSWFVDFDPVIDNALAAGNPIPEPLRERADARAEVESPLPQNIRQLFPASFQDSPLGPIPQGWDAGTLGDIADLNPESWSRNTRPTTIVYVDLSNTKWGKIESTVRYAATDAPSRAQRVLRPGDTIFGTVRPGNGSFTLISEEGLTGSTGFAALRPRRSEDRDFVYLATTDKGNIDRLAHLADGAAYPAVRPDVVGNTQIVIPAVQVLDAFNRAVAPCQDRVAAAERESRTLAALRDTLLPKLISGDLRLKNPERFLTEAD
ncbi:MAG: hypothetical protein ICCCNLDF_01357 [Planctomycetes bacterium]|nr:hypothetical protein [Planctomycetota bacterium]